MSIFIRQALLLLTSLLLFYSLIWHEANKDVLQVVFLSAFSWGLIITITQIMILFVFVKIRLFKTSIAFASIFLTGNFIFYVEGFSRDFLQASIAEQLLLTALFYVLSLLIFVSIRKDKKTYYGLQAIIIMGCLASLFWKDTTTTEAKHSDEVSQKLKVWKEIKLVKKPNIFVFIYDSLIPRKTAKMFLDYDPEYYESVEKHKGLIFENSFTQRVPTRPSLKAFMSLGDSNYKQGMITGKYDSPLAALFRNNGYSVITGTRQGYAMTRRGDAMVEQANYVDAYHYDKQERFSVSPFCLNLPKKGIFAYIERFYYFCSNSIKYLDTKQTRNGWPRQVLNITDAILKIEKPTISILYLYYPIGHTSADYNVNDLKMRDDYLKYFKNGSRFAAQHMEKLIDKITSKYPDSLILIWGDHGTFSGAGGYKNKAMEVLDRHQVFTALIGNKNICVQPEYLNDSDSEITSPAKVMLSIIRCLADEENIPNLSIGGREDHFHWVEKKYGIRIEDIVTIEQ